jgi:S-DNA-T family DNA segregation ATPase FtsK/SpoIIIE
MGFVLLLSLVTYDWHDIPTLRAEHNQPARNCFGPAGAYASYGLLLLTGCGSAIVPFWCAAFGLLLLLKPDTRLLGKVLWALLFTCALLSLLELRREQLQEVCARLNMPHAGGIPARLIARRLFVERVSGAAGTEILSWLILAASGVMLAGGGTIRRLYTLSVAGTRYLLGRISEWVASRRGKQEQIEREQRLLQKQQSRLEESVRKEEKRARRKKQKPVKTPPTPEPAVSEPTEPVTAKDEKNAQPAPRRTDPESEEGPQYELPGLNLLDDLPPAKDRAMSSDVTTTSRILKETLSEFGIEIEVTNFDQGPAVTRYELRPAPGVRVERIAGLSNNLALALKATSVRVQAPVPGKGVVGIEVPNTTTSKVFLREILEGEEWEKGTAALPLVLGQDVAGHDIIADLAGMPHLLVAGSTGSGKTVCMNSILMGLLMSRTPDQLRLMLVDPKIVELSAYNGLPHLVVPVITDPHKVAIGLRWAINEMEKRYKLFAKAGVRNIEGYNSRAIPRQQELFEADGADAAEEMPPRLPYVVICVDELADLMLVAQADIENCIARLAQLSRAVGIHMILATQRPSVNVITGTIKANFPARIAFQVAQRVDSRTILDANGADKLLGRGDMLFLPAGSNRLIRAQGAMVTDPEIKRVCDFIRDNGTSNYDVTIHDKILNHKGAKSIDTGEDDGMLEQAIQIIRETHRASTSSLQRRLRIGYTRAARMMDILEERGIVGPPRGSDPREILIDLDGDNAGQSSEDEDYGASEPLSENEEV